MSENQQHGNPTNEPKKYVFGSFPLYEHKTPEFRERQGYNYYFYGEDNTFPDYLIYLYNRSATHNAIVDGKCRFIFGSGWKIKDGSADARLQGFLKRPNAYETFDDLTKKVLVDRRIFGGYALKVVWLGGRMTSVEHIPFQKIRVSCPTDEYPTTKYFYSNEWTRNESTKAKFKASKKMPDDVKIYEPFNPSVKTGEQLLYVTDYRPQITVYPLPEYHATNASIETDIEIDNFHLNNIKTGFAAGTMITVYNGKPSQDEQSDIERQLKGKYTGSDNGGETVLYFAEPNETAPLIQPLRPNDLDKQYEQLKRDTQQNIFIGHNIVSPMLFGVKTEGQLGGRSEIDIAWQLLNINYVEPKRKEIEEDFNYLLSVGGYSGQIELQPMNRLGIEFTEATLTQVLTQEELRAIIAEQMGIKIDPKAVSQPTTPQPQPTQLEKMPADFDAILINEFSRIGIKDDGFEFASTEDIDQEQKLLSYLKENKKLDIKKATKELGFDVLKVIERLISDNIVKANISNNEIVVEEVKPENANYTLKTYWKYDWIPPYNDSDKKNSRDFCRRLLDLGRLYTKEEIDTLNNGMKDFNQDVWKYRGGWRTIPNTDGLLHVPSCRHEWKQVIRKERI